MPERGPHEPFVRRKEPFPRRLPRLLHRVPHLRKRCRSPRLPSHSGFLHPGGARLEGLEAEEWEEVRVHCCLLLSFFLHNYYIIACRFSTMLYVLANVMVVFDAGNVTIDELAVL